VTPRRFAVSRESAWRTGPPKWTFTAYGVALATVHLALAGFGAGRWFDLWEAAWPFYASLLAITSGSAVAIHYARRRNRGGAWGGDPYGTPLGYAGELYDGGGHDAGDGLDLPRPPVGGR